MSTYIRYPNLSVPKYSSLSAFPALALDGDLAIALDTDDLYAFNAGSVSWVLIGGPGSVISLGNLDAQAASSKGAALVSGVLSMQSASATAPGLVNTTTQSFAGAKTFTGAISASNLSGTNTGDVTLGTANGLSLSIQVLSLQAADASHTGALTSSDWTTFNNKQSALTLGNLTDAGTDGITITGGTSAVVGSGTSISQRVADATHNGYLSSTDWSTFNSKGSGTVTAVSVASANGFAGSSSGGATPALTLSTSISGILKGNGTAISAASISDYPSLTAQWHPTTEIVVDALNYTTVQAAVTAAEALAAVSASSGVTVLVPGGTFAETVTIRKNITLKGQDQGSTVINHIVIRPTSAIAAPDYVRLKDLQIDDITATNETAAGSGIYATLSMLGGGLEVSNCDITDGLSLSRINQAFFFRCRVNAGAGTSTLYNVNLLEFDHSDFEGNIFSYSLDDSDVNSPTMSLGYFYFNSSFSYAEIDLTRSGGTTHPTLSMRESWLATLVANNNTDLDIVDSAVDSRTLSGATHTITYKSGQAYTPATSTDWSTVPVTIDAGLDSLATSGIFKSQTQKTFLAAPNASNALASFRAIVSSDLPTVAVAQGGTGLTAGTSGGVPYYSSTSAITSSGLLANKGLMLGGGAGGSPSTLATSASTVAALISGGTNTAPSWGTLGLGGGGTGATTKAGAFDALSPMTTGGDLIYGGASGTGTRLANGSSGQFLKSNGGTAAPSWAAMSASYTAPTVTTLTSGAAATYTTPANALYLRIRMVGGGGGGAGSGGSSNSSNGGTGGDTLWKDAAGTTTLATAGGGVGGSFGNAAPVAGGTASIGTGPIGTALPGGGTDGAQYQDTANVSIARLKGGTGGSSFFGGAGGGGGYSNAGAAGATNTGGGGGGGGLGNVTSAYTGQGGSSGGYVEMIISSPTATYKYTVGAAGSSGGAGTSPNGTAGAIGGTGYIEVTEYYQ